MKRHVEAREFLGRGFELYRDIQIKKEKAASIRASLDNPTVSLNNERVSTTRNVSAMEDSIIRIIQLEEDIRNETLQLAIIQEKMPVDIKTLASCSALFQIKDTHEKVSQKIPVEVPQKHVFGH